MQIPLGGTFKDPGCFASSSAPGKSSPVTVSASVEGNTEALYYVSCCCCYLLCTHITAVAAICSRSFQGGKSSSPHADKDPSFLRCFKQ
jgi:hypothetical protein